MVRINPTVPSSPQRNERAGVASVLHRVKALADVPPPPQKILIYGGNRTGKTTLACQWPKPLLIISFEPSLSGGIESVRRIPEVHLIHVRPDNSRDLKRRGPSDSYISMEETVTLALDLTASKRFRTVVYDGCTSAQDLIGANLLDLPDVPDQKSWGTVPDGHYIERSEKFRAYLRPYLDIALDTIILAKEKDHNPPVEQKVTKSGKVMGDLRPRFLRGVTDKSFVAPDIGGGPCGWIMDSCESLFRLYVGNRIVTKTRPAIGQAPAVEYEEVVPDEFVRYLRAGYHPNYAAGIRSATPESVPDEIAEPTYEKILKVIGRTP